MLGDAALLERYARIGDAEAFAELVRRYAGMVYGTCHRVTASAQEAEDITQECFLELARKAGTIRSSLPGWLHTVARRRSVDAIRKDVARRRTEQEATAARNSATPDPNWADIAPLVDEALEKLSSRLREPVILHYLQGLTQAEVAARLGVSQPTVSRDLERAVTQLRAQLKKAGVVMTIGALAVLLTENGASAVPVQVAVGLGKIAISGIGAGVGTSAAASSGIAAVTTGLLGTLAGKVIIVSSIALMSVAGVRIYSIQRVPPARTHAPVRVLQNDVSGVYTSGVVLEKDYIALNGRIESVAEDGKSCVMLVQAVERPPGYNVTQLVPPRHKTVLCDFPEVRLRLPLVGRRFGVTGLNSGVGKPIRAQSYSLPVNNRDPLEKKKDWGVRNIKFTVRRR
jgi:RNA polymerase sigma factor (sigma-70 family)